MLLTMLVYVGVLVFASHGAQDQGNFISSSLQNKNMRQDRTTAKQNLNAIDTQSVRYFYYKPNATTKWRSPNSNSKSLGVSHFVSITPRYDDHDD
jgi:hypothetical protein